MKKRVLATLLAVILMTTTAVTGIVPAKAAGTNSDASQYVMLDGEWHFKLYRTYENMYQYFPYYPELAAGNWSDAEAAVLPSADTWQAWETVSLPADNPETGGLLSNEQFPSWSEAWAVRTFDLPANFTQDETVTLLLGIVDDNDVVYINGTAVAASGFIDGNGEALGQVPETGGFVFDADTAAEDQVKWSKSYWEIEREYKIPASLLNQGANEIAIRIYNNNSYGGFYSGHVYAICGNDLAVRALKGLPTQKALSKEVLDTVAVQIAALNAHNINAYAATIDDDYHNDAAAKVDRVAEMKALLDTYSDLAVSDADAAVYLDEDGNYWYSAVRTITGGGDVVSSEAVEICFAVSGGKALERGNWNRCYGTSYSSKLFGQELTYSVYLPPSYYENPNKVYPTVWLLHGRGSSSTSYRNVDNIGEFMDELIKADSITEMVLIMPDSGKLAFYQDTELDSNKDSTGPWMTQLVDELRKVAETNYRLIPDPAYRGLSGNSMGGYGAVMAGTTHPELYSSIGIHMGYLPEEALESIKSLTEDQLAGYDFYLDVGKQDTTVYPEGTIAVHEYLDSVDKDHGYDLRDGGHNSAFYMAGMAASMKMHSDHFLANGLPGGETPFLDVKDNDWFYDAVKYVYENGIMAGTGATTFEPAFKLNRATVAQVLYNWDRDSYAGADNDFKDVDDGQWYTDAVAWSAAEKIFSGYGGGKFGTLDVLTREQLAMVLYNYAVSKGYAISGQVSAEEYADADQLSDWAMEAVEWAIANDILSIDTNQINPTVGADRAEVAYAMMNFCKNVAK